MRFPFFRNRDSVKNGILISIRRTGDGFHPGLFNFGISISGSSIFCPHSGQNLASLCNLQPQFPQKLFILILSPLHFLLFTYMTISFLCWFYIFLIIKKKSWHTSFNVANSFYIPSFIPAIFL